MRRFNKKYADECYQIWREHKSAGTGALPTAPRFIFYELVDNGIIEKKPLEKGQRRPSQDVSDALMWLRRYKLDPNGGFNKDGSVKVVWCEPGENGLIPWDDIRDDTRSLRNFSGYPTFRAAVEARMSHPYLDPWKGRWPVIVAEDRAVAVSLEDLAREYRVPVTSTNGQAGGFIQTDVIPAVRENGRAHLVLYCGDLDRGGESIEGNLREQLGTEVEIERLLLTEEQAREHHLEGKMQFFKWKH